MQAVMERPRPQLGDLGLLRYDGRWVALSEKEEIACSLLLAAWSDVVPKAELAKVLWPEAPVGPSLLRTLIFRLRRRLKPLGLTVSTIRGRGFLLEDQSLCKSNQLDAGPSGTSPEGSTWPT